MSDIITFDFDDPKTFNDSLPQGTYPGTIEHCEVRLRRDDGTTAAKKFVLKVALQDIPEWGNVTRTVSMNIPDANEDTVGRQNFFGRNLKTLFDACGLRGLMGRPLDEVAELLIGNSLNWNVKAPGDRYQNINPV